MRPGFRDLVLNTGDAPDATLSLERYQRLAHGYDRTSRWAERVRAAAVESLGLREGDTVLDVACGSGLSIGHLQRKVGATGRVVGIDHSAQMIEIASAKLAEASERRVRLIHGAVESADLGQTFDAFLLCFTHDVLQSPSALANLIRFAKPRARVVLAGLRLLPWWWGAPFNLWNGYRTSCYLTTFNGLRAPWRPMLRYCPNLTIVRTFWFGAYYVATGVVTPER